MNLWRVVNEQISPQAAQGTPPLHWHYLHENRIDVVGS